MQSLKVITSAVAAALCLCVLFAVPPLCAAAARQERRPPVRRDAASLRRDLAAALGGEFEIVRDELVRRSTYHGGGAYWLAHVRPKRAGHFTLKYTYKYDDPWNRKDPLYTHVEHEIPLGVGPRGCRRRPQHMAYYFPTCLGDTVIVPVVLDAYKRVYTEHTFEFTVNSITPAPQQDRGAGRGAEQFAGEEPSNKEPVANPLAEHLKYVGRTVAVMPHRASGFTAEYYVTFEAVKPGRFNLSVRGGTKGAPPPPAADAAGSVPVIIVARGTPVTWLAGRENVRGYSGRFASNSGNNYLITPVVMQPGERLTLRYAGFSRRGLRYERDEREPSGQELEGMFVPVITRLPFRVERETEYNEWIIDHLPAPR